ncbi:MAG: dihydropyrimidinase [Ignavibacteria bacterium]|nr:dihydropyrimidinase [Ignavibacteria bacterium]
MMSILIKNGTIVTDEGIIDADIFAEGELISAIGKDLSCDADRIVDATKRLVMPGGIDVHTHLELPVGDIVSSDDFETGTRAAAFGGTTSIIDFPTQLRGQSLMEAYDVWRAKAQKATIDYGFHMIIADVSGNQLDEIDELVAEGITSFKVFTAYPDRLMIDDEALQKIMVRVGRQGGIVAVHAENEASIAPLVKKALAEGRKSPLNHALTRPASSEAEAVARVIALARIADAPIYIVHVTCAEALAEIARARREWPKIFGETCPHYLFLTKDDLDRPSFEGAKYVLTPPLRETRDHDALWNGLCAGDLQVVSTDHCPFMFETQKKRGIDDFTKIPNGGPGIENRLQLLYHFGVNKKRISVREWVDLVATNPAKIFGLYPRKGTLKVGGDADIVMWNPDQMYTISAKSHHMRVDYSMFEGFEVRGNAETVISRGEIIVEKNQWFGRTGRGRFLKRARFDASVMM